jgi:hypothetical protein
MTNTAKDNPISFIAKLKEPVDYSPVNYAKEFHEATGGVWHEREQVGAGYFKCSCSNEKHSYYYNEFLYQHTNPTYDNAADILKRMKEYCGEERYYKFVIKSQVGIGYMSALWIADTYILNAPALLQKCVEFFYNKTKEN